MGRTEFPDLKRLRAALVGLAEPSTRAKWRALRSARVSTLKKYLTGTTLSEMGIFRQVRMETAKCLLARRSWGEWRVYAFWRAEWRRTVAGFWPVKLWALLHVWDIRQNQTDNLHASQEFLSIRGAVNLFASSFNADQTVARSKIQQSVSGIFQFQSKVDTFSAS